MPSTASASLVCLLVSLSCSTFNCFSLVQWVGCGSNAAPGIEIKQNRRSKMLKVLVLQVIVLIGSSCGYFSFKSIVLEIWFFLGCSYLTENEWFCKNDADCRPWKMSQENAVENVYENQNICRLLCGKFGGLWPKPTGACELGKAVMDVNTDLIRWE